PVQPSPIQTPNSMAGTLDLSSFQAQGNEQFKQADTLEKNNELLELLLFCEDNASDKSLDIFRNNLKSKLITNSRIETKYKGKDAYWFYKDSMTIGRVDDADHKLSNQATSRKPIEFSKQGNRFSIKIVCEKDFQIKPVELQLENHTGKQLLVPDTLYPLESNGVLIFSICFPIEFRVLIDRFLIMNFLDPTDCIKKNYNFDLDFVWNEFKEETSRILILGK
ncbi:MAG: hypothetical protein HQK93_08660, partial [Nitrospirae bacterium]|nr:hypothetical protein [Nitrospirota bacterium]